MLVAGDPVAELQPIPDWFPGRAAVPFVSGAVLVVAGACVGAGYAVRRAGVALAALFAVWVGLLHAPRLLVDPRNAAAWTGGAEVLALAAAAWIAAGLPAARARRCFGIAFPVFGVLHFIYRDYIVAVTPGWIPVPVFWAYATGVAHIAAGIGIALDLKARLAALLLGAMLGSWVLIVHLPRVAANAGSRPEWTSLCVALALCGGAWLVARSRTS